MSFSDLFISFSSISNKCHSRHFWGAARKDFNEQNTQQVEKRFQQQNFFELTTPSLHDLHSMTHDAGLDVTPSYKIVVEKYNSVFEWKPTRGEVADNHVGQLPLGCLCLSSCS